MFDFIVETGEGKEDATSYVSVEEADQYIEAFFGQEDQWFDKSESQKEIELINATRFFDVLLRWSSTIQSTKQSLAFPRKTFKDREGRSIEEGSINNTVKESVIRIAHEGLRSNLSEEAVFLRSQDYGDSREVYANAIRDGGNDYVFQLRKDLMRKGYGTSYGTIVEIERA